MRGTCGFMTVGQVLNTAQPLDIFVQSPDIFVQLLGILYALDFIEVFPIYRICPADLSDLMDKNVHKQFWCQNHRKQIFIKTAMVSTGYEIFILEQFLAQTMQYILLNATKTPRLREARPATGNMPPSGLMRQSLTYVSIRLGICGNGQRRDVMKRPSNQMDRRRYTNEKFIPSIMRRRRNLKTGGIYGRKNHTREHHL